MICLAPLCTPSPYAMERKKGQNEKFRAESTSNVSVIRTDDDDNELMPLTFFPSDKDVICGRARENFHHGKLGENTSELFMSVLRVAHT